VDNLPVIFGVVLDSAEEDWPGRNRLFERMAQLRPVVFLERRRKGSLLPRMERLPNGSYVLRAAFGLSAARQPEFCKRFTRRLDAALFSRALRREGLTPYVFWLETPRPELLDHISPAATIYDCMDPCFVPSEQAAHERRERICVERAGIVIATAASLERRMRTFGAAPIRLPNAADERDLESTLSYSDVRAELGLHGPVATYLGTIDSRVDLTLLTAVAVSMPDWQFLLCGRVNHDRERETQVLRTLPNVRITGSVDGFGGQRAIVAADVCLVPFREAPISDAINPVKVFSYLSFGKRVVATDIEECRTSRFVTTASGAAAFVAALKHEYLQESRSAERKAFAAANTWSIRAAEASVIIDQTVGAAPAPQSEEVTFRAVT